MAANHVAAVETQTYNVNTSGYYEIQSKSELLPNKLSILVRLTSIQETSQSRAADARSFQPRDSSTTRYVNRCSTSPTPANPTKHNGKRQHADAVFLPKPRIPAARGRYSFGKSCKSTFETQCPRQSTIVPIPSFWGIKWFDQ
jgi:hypothetical protein